MSNKIITEISNLLEDQRSFIKNVEALNDKQLNWIPKGSKNSIGILLDHLIGSEKSLLHQTLFNIEINRDRNKEFEQKSRSLKELISSYKTMSQESKRLLTTKLTDENLFDERIRGDKKRTVLWVLEHVLEHNNYHIGQIYLLLAMVKEL